MDCEWRDSLTQNLRKYDIPPHLTLVVYPIRPWDCLFGIIAVFAFFSKISKISFWKKS